ncbi:helix-turn-helix domain-containing protein [Glaesserella parasuis]|uniref:Helix-turn-helix transcriptional regulator n=1 Tax=Glaesserella parasuis TaxID=738 RepID=A0A859IDL4_GLAPU|nr:helix-turn-helix transcriptional regulator [Glaesserella parasuis]MDG6239287.1 helix-turn-helix transcriptional regulator [Glaesserella parasuis]MDO9778697.1 helix-turn-helix transcriptional regulator [Glaesserella parasuis]MDP0207179.1 helix-turn-helix transcriptional regulator [Glaesserella parasuis]MWQ05888.1 helix-turn-helix domain-containing protein [Glaesserella parasuis]MWQ80548.1 helix-turn-helix domain-containing protein [Glaesserella parasuis]
MNINDKIRLFREDHQLSQEEMATKLSMSTKGYAKIERGETRVNFERLEQILRVLNADIYELLTYGENKGITISTGNNNTNASSNIFLGSDDVEKLNLMLAHKDEIIKLKDDVIESLRNEISLLKEKLSTQQ